MSITTPSFSAPSPTSSRRKLGCFIYNESRSRTAAVQVFSLVCTMIPAFPSPTGGLAHKVTLQTKPLGGRELVTFLQGRDALVNYLQRLSTVPTEKADDEALCSAALAAIAKWYEANKNQLEFAPNQRPYFPEGASPTPASPTSQFDNSIFNLPA